MSAPFIYHPLGLLIQEHYNYRPDRCSVWFVPVDVTKTEVEEVTRDKLYYTGYTMMDILRTRSERYDEMDRIKCTIASFITLLPSQEDWSNIQHATKEHIAFLMTVLPTDVVTSIIIPLLGEHITKHMHEVVELFLDAEDAKWVCVCDNDDTVELYSNDGFKIPRSTKTAQVMYRNETSIFYKSAVIHCKKYDTYNFRGDDHEF